MKFAAVLALSSIAAVAAADIVAVGNSIAKLDSTVTALYKLINATDGTDLDKDLVIESKSEDLNAVIQKTTSLANNLKPKNAVNVNLANGIIKTLTGTEGNTKALCAKLAKDRAGYNAAGVPPFVYAVTKALSNSVDDLGTAFLGITPAGAAANAKKLIADFKSDLKVCTSAYKSYDF